MALFAGPDNLAAIQRYAQFLTQAQRAWLGFPRKKGTSFRKVPSYSALRNLLIRIDPHQLADCLNRWLQANLGTLPRALALDGKWIRDRALSLCLSDHQSGAPVAMGFAKQKTQDDQQQSKDDYKREGEHTVALRLYATTNLQKLQPQLQPLGPAHLPDRAQGGPSPRGFLACPAGALPEQSSNPFPDTRQAPLQMKRPCGGGGEAVHPDVVGGNRGLSSRSRKRWSGDALVPGDGSCRPCLTGDEDLPALPAGGRRPSANLHPLLARRPHRVTSHRQQLNPPRRGCRAVWSAFEE